MTDDNPRSEDPAAIRAADARRRPRGAARPARRGAEVGDRRRGDRRRPCALRRAGDIVLVAGKGHEQGQEIAGVVHPFDDRAVLRAGR